MEVANVEVLARVSMVVLKGVVEDCDVVEDSIVAVEVDVGLVVVVVAAAVVVVAVVVVAVVRHRETASPSFLYALYWRWNGRSSRSPSFMSTDFRSHLTSFSSHWNDWHSANLVHSAAQAAVEGAV